MGCASSADADCPAAARRAAAAAAAARNHVVIDDFDSTPNPLRAAQAPVGISLEERVASSRQQHAQWARRTAQEQQRRARHRHAALASPPISLRSTTSDGECPFTWVRDDTAPEAVIWPPTNRGALSLPPVPSSRLVTRASDPEDDTSGPTSERALS
uniref:Uncharacterized protein n=1 Tax=Neobodo designis TaxID=312471 RepID=A0A7S1LF92_NEODS